MRFFFLRSVRRHTALPGKFRFVCFIKLLKKRTKFMLQLLINKSATCEATPRCQLRVKHAKATLHNVWPVACNQLQVFYRKLVRFREPASNVIPYPQPADNRSHLATLIYTGTSGNHLQMQIIFVHFRQKEKKSTTPLCKWQRCGNRELSKIKFYPECTNQEASRPTSHHFTIHKVFLLGQSLHWDCVL